MRDFKPLTLANMRLNGVHSVIASCPNCGRSADELDPPRLAYEPTAGCS
jgi:hypothetical protein